MLFEVKAVDTDITLARFGDGTNYTQISTGGNVSFAGTATLSAAGATSSIPMVVGTGTASGITAAGQMYFESDTEILTIGDGATSISLDMAPNVVYTFPAATSTLQTTTGSPAAMVIASQATGDLLYAPSASAWARLGIQAAGYVLGGGATPAWTNAPQITTVELGAAADTTLSRSAAGVLAVEGVDLAKITSTQVLNFGGATLEIPNSDDPDTSVTGQIAFDTDGWMRVYNNTRQEALARVQEEIHVTVVKPQDMADAVRDAFLIWSNESGMTFTVTGWKAWAGADDTSLNIETTAADGSTNATVDAVEIATGSGPYTASDTTITAGTIANGSLIWLDFDDTDDPSYVKIVIYGYYNADVN